MRHFSGKRVFHRSESCASPLPFFESRRDQHQTRAVKRRSLAIKTNPKLLFQIRSSEICNFLPLAAFGGAPYGVDETSIAKSVFKAHIVASKLILDSSPEHRTLECEGDRIEST